MQRIGTDIFRKLDPDFWVKAMRMIISHRQLVLIGDVRFQNEAALIRELNGKVYKIVSNRGIAEELHVTEQNLPDELFDKVIVNHYDKSFEKELLQLL